jgi:hypothetical protein
MHNRMVRSEDLTVKTAAFFWDMTAHFYRSGGGKRFLRNASNLPHYMASHNSTQKVSEQRGVL